VRAEVLTWLRSADRAAEAPYDIVLIDPPYDETESMTTALEAISAVVGRGARVVAKHFWRTAPPPMVGLLASERERRFGDTALTFYRPTEDA
jgi:16S rRNA G966 N2-methylase RsmD